MTCAWWSGRHFYCGPCRRSFMCTNQVWCSLPLRCHAQRHPPSLAIRFSLASSPLSHLPMPPSCILHASVYPCFRLHICLRLSWPRREGEERRAAAEHALTRQRAFFSLDVCLNTGAVLSDSPNSLSTPDASLRTPPADCVIGLVCGGKNVRTRGQVQPASSNRGRTGGKRRLSRKLCMVIAIIMITA